MPTRNPIPIGQSAMPVGSLGGPLNPVDWIDQASPNGLAGAVQSALMRGTPGTAWWQRRQQRGPATIPQGGPFWLHSRGYSRGAGAYSPRFGVIPVNPIGAGIHAPYKLPVIAGPGARYQFGAIWFDVQTIPTTIRMQPTMPIESVNSLLATSYVAGMYATTG
jgi:hypothetical protein